MLAECTIYKKVKKVVLSEIYIKKLVEKIIKKEKKQGMASLHLIGEQRMKRMNEGYAGKNGATDVLAFAMQDGDQMQKFKKVDLGDIFICVPFVKRQAKKNVVSQKSELKRVIIHGVLHLLGYDHKTQAGEKKMFARQEKYVNEEIW